MTAAQYSLALRGRVLGDVGDPQPVRGVDGELPVDQVELGCGGRVADGAAAASAPVEALDAGLAHQPGDPLAVDRQAQARASARRAPAGEP